MQSSIPIWSCLDSTEQPHPTLYRLLNLGIRPARSSTEMGSCEVCRRLYQFCSFGNRRWSARRSRSVRPPQTPYVVFESNASDRHSNLTGQLKQTCRTCLCAAPRTKRLSGSTFEHAACAAQVCPSNKRDICAPSPEASSTLAIILFDMTTVTYLFNISVYLGKCEMRY